MAKLPDLASICEAGSMAGALQGLLTGQITVDQRELLAFIKASRSSTEAEWLRLGHLRLVENMLGQVVFWGYEWVTFRLPGGSYTPDYFYMLQSGVAVYVEIKGSKRQANYRDARSKLRAAASLNPWAWFYEARLGRRTWEIERITPDRGFVQALIRFGDGA